MEMASIYEATASRRKVEQDQRAWKYIQDLNELQVGDLNKTALIDGNKEYSYGQMFREWERYASVFTALEMTEKQHARVGVLGSTCAETIFAFYGLNLVGAEVSVVQSYSAFNFARVEATITQEKLTDFILTDDLAQQDLVRELLVKRKELGLHHVLILHVPVAGPTALPMLSALQEAKHASMKALYQPIFMESLLAAYGSHSIHYASQEPSEAAFILHTSGTTSGTGKPVPMSDSALNASVARFMMMKDLSLPFDHLVTAMMVDLSNAYGIIDQVHLPFALGATVVVVPAGLLNPLFYKAVSAYRISFLFSVNSMIERWMKMPEDTKFDFTSLKFVALGGTAVSAAEKRRYHDFIEAHGGEDVTILNGYGLSELGGACCLSTPDVDDESIGYPLPEIDIRLYDDEAGRFFSPQGEVSEGVLYMSARSMASRQLDGQDAIKVDMVDQQPYVCSNDLVRVDADGKITYLGRANRFFLAEEGRKYESGRVETEFSRLASIESCAIVPVFHKMTHDNLPMLCVKTLDEAGDPKDVIIQALRQVFIDEKTLPEEYVPFRVLLAKTLPRNANGKIDLFALNRGQVDGEAYTIEQVRKDKVLTDFELATVEEGPTDVVDMIIGSMSADIESNMPANKLMAMLKNEPPTLGDLNDALTGYFDTTRQMCEQTMSNAFGMMGQMFPWLEEFMPPQTPEIASMREMIPDPEYMMPEIQKMMKHMQDMMMNNPIMMKGVAQTVLPVFHQQHLQMLSSINKMNQMAFDMSKRFHDQNNKMAKEWFDFTMRMAGVDPDETD